MQNALKMNNVTKTFRSGPRKKTKVTALGKIHLEIPESEIFGFLGPNGAGKSTAIRLLPGLLKPDSEEIFIGGSSVRTAKKIASALLRLY